LTEDELADWAGYEIGVVKRHHGYVSGSPFYMTGNVKIYGEGTSTTPGDIITTQPFEVTANTWHDIELDDPVPIVGNEDIWVSIQCTHSAGQYPAGMDPGPYTPGKSDWISLGSWIELIQYGWSTNWNVWAGVKSGISAYVPIGTQSLEAIMENIGTFPELDMECYADMYEYITDCEIGTLLQSYFIDNIDIETPLIGTADLTFGTFDFTLEGNYALDINLVDEDDDDTGNNFMHYQIGADGTAPTSTHVLTPSAPDGDNGWYVSDLTVALSAQDPTIGCEKSGSGVKEIRYTIDGTQYTLPGESGTFVMGTDGEDIEVEYWAVDNVGNAESKHTFFVDMDQTIPEVPPVITYDAVLNEEDNNWYVTFSVNCVDATSGMNRVEWSLNGDWQNTVTGDGPEYTWTIQWSPDFGLPTVWFTATAFDEAGNNDFVEIQGPDIHSQSMPGSQSQQSQMILKQKMSN